MLVGRASGGYEYDLVCSACGDTVRVWSNAPYTADTYTCGRCVAPAGTRPTLQAVQGGTYTERAQQLGLLG